MQWVGGANEAKHQTPTWSALTFPRPREPPSASRAPGLLVLRKDGEQDPRFEDFYHLRSEATARRARDLQLVFVPHWTVRVAGQAASTHWKQLLLRADGFSLPSSGCRRKCPRREWAAEDSGAPEGTVGRGLLLREHGAPRWEQHPEPPVPHGLPGKCFCCPGSWRAWLAAERPLRKGRRSGLPGAERLERPYLSREFSETEGKHLPPGRLGGFRPMP